jgi:Ca-activated chloride channel family protein
MSTTGKYHTGPMITAVVVAEVLAWGLLLAGWWLLQHEVRFRFDRPDALKALFAGPVLVLIYVLDIIRRDRALARFASEATLPRMVPGISSGRSVLRFMALRHGLGFVVLALAGPLYGTRAEEVKAKGIDVIVAVDVSNSMLCEDLPPSRMEAARRALSQLIDRLRGDRIGIVIFAGDAFVQLPLTADRSAARMFLSTLGPSYMNAQGTAIAEAIEMAQRGFDPESAAGRAIIVITDGEDHEGDAEGAAGRAAEAGIVVHTVGMGTPQGGPLPIRRNGQLQGFRKDGNGNTVVSRLNEAMLRDIAAAGNGRFIRATATSAGLEELVSELKQMDSAETGTYRFTAYEDRFQYPLALGTLLILVGLAIGERRRTNPIRLPWT